jgi:UDPglucose 6-dehydrogenase/GDP-mannose 6-dehydrogenase
MRVNESQPSKIISVLEKQLGPLAGMRICVLGIAFKPDTDDIRESPAIRVIHALIERGAVVSAHDPVAQGAAHAALPPGKVTFPRRLKDATNGVDALVLVTRWEEYRKVPALLAQMASPPLLVDGRRMLDKRTVPRYAGIGL